MILWEKSKLANLKNYFQPAQNENNKVDSIELTFEEEQRRSELVRKLKQGEISLTEAQELRNLLEREKHMISQLGNCLAILAITFLISYVDEYLESKSNRLLASSEA